MGKLKVYYGWSRITGIRKRIAISVMFENDLQGCRSERGQRCLNTMQETVFERFQTKEEEEEGKRQNRIFTEYCLFFDDKKIKGSLEKILYINSEADKNNISKSIRDRIYEELKKAFILSNPGYEEPNKQMSFKFESL